MNKIFYSIARSASSKFGSPAAFLIAFLVVLGWAVCGPIFHFSNTWQLVINTGTTIVTFLMVFLIQSSQNNDTVAIHAKLDELLREATKVQEKQYIGIEDDPERLGEMKNK